MVTKPAGAPQPNVIPGVRPGSVVDSVIHVGSAIANAPTTVPNYLERKGADALTGLGLDPVLSKAAAAGGRAVVSKAADDIYNTVNSIPFVGPILAPKTFPKSPAAPEPPDFPPPGQPGGRPGGTGGVTSPLPQRAPFVVPKSPMQPPSPSPANSEVSRQATDQLKDYLNTLPPPTTPGAASTSANAADPLPSQPASPATTSSTAPATPASGATAAASGTDNPMLYAANNARTSDDDNDPLKKARTAFNVNMQPLKDATDAQSTRPDLVQTDAWA